MTTLTIQYSELSIDTMTVSLIPTILEISLKIPAISLQKEKSLPSSEESTLTVMPSSLILNSLTSSTLSEAFP